MSKSPSNPPTLSQTGPSALAPPEWGCTQPQGSHWLSVLNDRTQDTEANEGATEEATRLLCSFPAPPLSHTPDSSSYRRRQQLPLVSVPSEGIGYAKPQNKGDNGHV